MRLGFKTLGTRHCGSTLFRRIYLENCVFCLIAEKKLDSQIIYEDDISLAFKDINPVAPFHVLVIPKKHIRSLGDVEDFNLVSHLLYVCNLVAQKEGLTKGYRVVTNVGDDGGQTVFHLHFHVIGGRPMDWPPG
ncbi:histidine triad (HIT) family protein [Thermodesulfobium acidiphilum]|uniref:Histidine triad (HIT) family protein n=1 Tax=Thermodesulfobium acidiphilum TaxID=1794699 RepID=A0A2R4W251_THEAF|nr:histidine triad nucleotide-binding protein [Thermodesulfobium acidiphilum]AWB10824.1 histidine triad (HIT) family protein [Thermodesulfobium acidiphilum]